MRKIFLLLCGILPAILMQAQTELTLKKWNNEQLSFSFPANWQLDESEKNAATELVNIITKNGNYIAVSQLPTGRFVTPEEIHKMEKGKLTNTYPDFTITRLKDTVCGPYTAIHLTSEGIFEKRPMWYSTFTVVLPVKLITFSFFYFRERRAEFETAIQQLINSIDIIVQ